jgi:hypothetical protein
VHPELLPDLVDKWKALRNREKRRVGDVLHVYTLTTPVLIESYLSESGHLQKQVDEGVAR